MKEQRQLSMKRNATFQDCNALEEALVKLAGMPEKELKNAKKAAWFGQVYDLVMFTDNEELSVADRISLVEQAQQILIDMLLALSETDESMFSLLRQHREELQIMCEQTIWLYSRIKRLKKIVDIGGDDAFDVRGISENAKKVLCALLHRLQENPRGSAPNELQKEFVSFMFRYLGLMDPRIDDPIGALEVFFKDPYTMKKMLTCCLEYIYLGTCNERAYNGYGELIDRFMVSTHEEHQIEDEIAQLYRYRGVKGFYSRYLFDKGDVSRICFVAEFEREENRKMGKYEDFTKCFQILGEMGELCGRKSSNFMYSPASLYSALQAAAYGADGRTYREIIKLTGKKTYDLKSEAVNVWNFLVVNGKEDWQARVRDEYEQSLRTDQNLNATIYELTDENCEQLVGEINSRCKRETNGQIAEAVSPEDFQDTSPLDIFTAFLGNVLHFKGTWREHCRLDKYFYFTGKDGNRRQADAVNMNSDELHYYYNKTVEAFSAPYQEDGGRYTFWGFLPSENGESHMSRCQSICIGAAENESTFSGKVECCDIDSLDLSGLKEPKEEYKLQVEIPKFLFRSGIDMTETLKNFGVNVAFDRQKADFSKGFSFFEDNNVYLNAVRQQSFIDFNEKGMEASAVTGMCFDIACLGSTELEIWLQFDHPFYFMIWDDAEKLPLFVGQVFEPTQR